MKYLSSYFVSLFLFIVAGLGGTRNIFSLFSFEKKYFFIIESVKLFTNAHEVSQHRQPKKASFMKERASVLSKNLNADFKGPREDDTENDTASSIIFPAAIVFDIDGVLRRNKTPIPGAAESIKLCEEYNIPFMFLTNSGGVSEEKKIEQLETVLGVNLREADTLHYDHFKYYIANPYVFKDKELENLSQFYLKTESSRIKSKEAKEIEQQQKIDGNKFSDSFAVNRMQLSHSPMKALVNKYSKQFILAVGNRNFRHILKEYGFENVYTASDVVQIWPVLTSHFKEARVYDPVSVDLKQKLLTRAYNQQFNKDGANEIEFNPKTMPKPSLILKPDVILAVHDPSDWPLETLVLIESLYPHAFDSEDGKRKYQVPFYASCVDLLFSSSYPHPLLSPATFFIALDAIVKAVYSQKLQVKILGKPFETAYKASEKCLYKMAKRILQQNVLASPLIHHIINSYIQNNTCEEETNKLHDTKREPPPPRSEKFYSFLKSLKSPEWLSFLFSGTNAFREFEEQRTGISMNVDTNLNSDQLKSLILMKKFLTENIEKKMGIRFENIYMIGDTISDVKTAIYAKGPWKSILVKTGVWKPKEGDTNDKEYPADYVFNNVQEAVKLVIENHSLRPIDMI